MKKQDIIATLLESSTMQGCRKHGNKFRRYSLKFDSVFCSKCNRWLESRCTDGDCYFCKERPRWPVVRRK